MKYFIILFQQKKNLNLQKCKGYIIKSQHLIFEKFQNINWWKNLNDCNEKEIYPFREKIKEICNALLQ